MVLPTKASFSLDLDNLTGIVLIYYLNTGYLRKITFIILEQMI